MSQAGGASGPVVAAPDPAGRLDESARLELAHKVLQAIRDPGRVTIRRHPLGHREALDLWQTRAVMAVVTRALRRAAARRMWWPTEKAYRLLDSARGESEGARHE